MASPTNTVRRSVSLPPDLVSEAVKSAPPALKGNFNRLVRTALEEYIRSQKARAFAVEMQAMAEDPDIQREGAVINQEFAPAEADGLGEAE